MGDQSQQALSLVNNSDIKAAETEIPAGTARGLVALFGLSDTAFEPKQYIAILNDLLQTQRVVKEDNFTIDLVCARTLWVLRNMSTADALASLAALNTRLPADKSQIIDKLRSKFEARSKIQK